MKISIKDTVFDLIGWEWLTVKEYRMIEPVLIQNKFQYTIETIIWVVKGLVVNMTPEEAEEAINSLDIEEMNDLIVQVSELMDSKKKTKD